MSRGWRDSCLDSSTLIKNAEAFLKLEPLLDHQMLILVEDELGVRRVSGSKTLVDRYFEGDLGDDLEIILDQRKKNMIERNRLNERKKISIVARKILDEEQSIKFLLESLTHNQTLRCTHFSRRYQQTCRGQRDRNSFSSFDGHEFRTLSNHLFGARQSTIYTKPRPKLPTLSSKLLPSIKNWDLYQRLLVG